MLSSSASTPVTWRAPRLHYRLTAASSDFFLILLQFFIEGLGNGGVKVRLGMINPKLYVEKVYAGILGKIIGVYLGRPFEGWTYNQIKSELGEIWYYVHDHFGVPLIVADDDISGTFTFVRALADHGVNRSITAEQVGLTWLNYIVEERSILWWGGFGNSSEHTAFLRLKEGVPAPQSGSIGLNGRTMAEQVGAQIFIDSWALVAPGDPDLAVELAGKAGSVSHDGEAVYAAQLLAAMESDAFIENDLQKLLEAGLSRIPAKSMVTQLVQQIRSWSVTDGDWRQTRARIEAQYGYDKFPGNCHVIPNHALIILGLLYGQDNFQRSLMITNTSGWDTDCNSGNVGCLLGIKNGLAGLDQGDDFRSLVADRLYLSTADGGRCISDAVRETYQICRVGSALMQAVPLSLPKKEARFHFDLPGSYQGFRAVSDRPAGLELENVSGHSKLGERSLALRLNRLGPGSRQRVATPTFIPLDSKDESHYCLMACPTLFSGQKVSWALEADSANSAEITLSPFVSYYDSDDQLTRRYGQNAPLQPGEYQESSWLIDDLDGAPIAEFGFELAAQQTVNGTIYLDYVDWKGAPTTSWQRPAMDGRMWRRAWINAVDYVGTRWASAFHLSQSKELGLFIQGSRDWQDYRVTTTLTADPAKFFGVAARNQGLLRYYALLLGPGQQVRLVRQFDRELTELAAKPYHWEWAKPYQFQLEVIDDSLACLIDGKEIIRVRDTDKRLRDGGIALVCSEALITTDRVEVVSLELAA